MKFAKYISGFALVVTFMFAAQLSTGELKKQSEAESSSASVSAISTINTTETTTIKKTEIHTTTQITTNQLTTTHKKEIQSRKKPKKKITNSNNYEIPSAASAFKTYMDYTCITATGSPQYKLQQQAWTDENGLRRIDDYYCIALGSYYSKTIGDKFLITLSTGKQFKGILADQKADEDTDSNNQYTVYNGDMIEFIVKTSSLPSSVRISGDISSIGKFKGKITKIEKIN